MTALAVVIAFVVGVACSEALSRSVQKNAWPARRFDAVRTQLHCFHEAGDDEARQRYLIGGGLATLTLSLAMLVAIVGLGAVFAAPMLLLPWDGTQFAVYIAVSAICAIAWWILRRRR